jgi:hypothetical protein
MVSSLRASLRLSKIAPGDFVTAFNPGYQLGHAGDIYGFFIPLAVFFPPL